MNKLTDGSPSEFVDHRCRDNLSPDLRSAIASKGGKAVAAQKGSSHMAEIGRKGGMAVSRNKDHMRQIGRKGGLA